MKAKVREGVTYGPGGIHPAGTILEIIQAELDAFGDKLELMAEPELEPAATAQAVALAKELGLSLKDIPGTGQAGRITLSDVREALEG